MGNFRDCGVATELRGWMIVTALAQLRARGLFERYAREREPNYGRLLDAAVPNDWLPAAAGRAHYEAMDRLQLSAAEIVSLGHGVSTRVHRPVLAVAAKLAAAAPWILMPHAERIWPRIYRGGGAFEVTRNGEKSGDVDILGFPFADVPFCRIAWRGIILAGLELFAPRACVREVPARCTATSLGYHFYWT